MSQTTFTCLLDGMAIEPPEPLSSQDDIAELLDWMADTNHGPNGTGPESRGAELALGLAIHHVAASPSEATSAFMTVLRAATAREDEAERKAPSAQTALEAHRALAFIEDGLTSHARDERGFGRLVRGLLISPMHIRYALSIVATLNRNAELFDAITAQLRDVEEVDQTYIDMLRRQLDHE